nr:MAG TPA: hypothetical protein [Caudoviricetes sp.]
MSQEAGILYKVYKNWDLGSTSFQTLVSVHVLEVWSFQ